MVFYLNLMLTLLPCMNGLSIRSKFYVHNYFVVLWTYIKYREVISTVNICEDNINMDIFCKLLKDECMWGVNF